MTTKEPEHHIAIFWDIENTPPPSATVVSIETTVKKITSYALDFGIIDYFKAYLDTSSLSSEIRAALVDNGVEIIDVPHVERRKQNACDDVMKLDICFYALRSLPGRLHQVLLISGDGDFSTMVNRFTQQKIPVFIIYPDKVTSKLLLNATQMTIPFNTLLGIDDKKKMKVPIKEEKVEIKEGKNIVEKEVFESNVEQTEPLTFTIPEDQSLDVEIINALIDILRNHPRGLPVKDVKRKLRQLNILWDKEGRRVVTEYTDIFEKITIVKLKKGASDLLESNGHGELMEMEKMEQKRKIPRTPERRSNHSKRGRRSHSNNREGPIPSLTADQILQTLKKLIPSDGSSVNVGWVNENLDKEVRRFIKIKYKSLGRFLKMYPNKFYMEPNSSGCVSRIVDGMKSEEKKKPMNDVKLDKKQVIDYVLKMMPDGEINMGNLQRKLEPKYVDWIKNNYRKISNFISDNSDVFTLKGNYVSKKVLCPKKEVTEEHSPPINTNLVPPDQLINNQFDSYSSEEEIISENEFYQFMNTKEPLNESFEDTDSEENEKIRPFPNL